MQIISNGDNLHELSNPFFFSGKNKKKNVINLLSAELAQRVVGDNHKIYLGVNGLQIEHNAHD